jgi:solute carrier family 25 (mitochondrial phosphate transporter), member 3
VLKINMADYFGVEDAWKYRFPIYLTAAAGAEFVADVFLCPLEVS